LKKQTQFSNGHNDVNSMITMVYGEFCWPRQQKNKPNIFSSWLMVRRMDSHLHENYKKQISASISVNLRLIRLKKQSQFAGMVKWRKFLYERNLWQ